VEEQAQFARAWGDEDATPAPAQCGVGESSAVIGWWGTSTSTTCRDASNDEPALCALKPIKYGLTLTRTVTRAM